MLCRIRMKSGAVVVSKNSTWFCIWCLARPFKCLNFSFLSNASQAARAMNTCYIASTYSTCTLEDISAAAPGGLRWFQLYIHRNRAASQQLVQRAEALGFQGLVLTADLPYTGKRRDDVRNGFRLPPHMKVKNLEQAFEVCKMSLSFHSLCWLAPHETKTTG